MSKTLTFLALIIFVGFGERKAVGHLQTILQDQTKQHALCIRRKAILMAMLDNLQNCLNSQRKHLNQSSFSINILQFTYQTINLHKLDGRFLHRLALLLMLLAFVIGWRHVYLRLGSKKNKDNLQIRQL